MLMFLEVGNGKQLLDGKHKPAASKGPFRRSLIPFPAYWFAKWGSLACSARGEKKEGRKAGRKEGRCVRSTPWPGGRLRRLPFCGKCCLTSTAQVAPNLRPRPRPLTTTPQHHRVARIQRTARKPAARPTSCRLPTAHAKRHALLPKWKVAKGKHDPLRALQALVPLKALVWRYATLPGHLQHPPI